VGKEEVSLEDYRPAALMPALLAHPTGEHQRMAEGALLAEQLPKVQSANVYDP
jgi:hypothetical protein